MGVLTVAYCLDQILVAVEAIVFNYVSIERGDTNWLGEVSGCKGYTMVPPVESLDGVF